MSEKIYLLKEYVDEDNNRVTFKIDTADTNEKECVGYSVLDGPNGPTPVQFPINAKTAEEAYSQFEAAIQAHVKKLNSELNNPRIIKPQSMAVEEK